MVCRACRRPRSLRCRFHPSIVLSYDLRKWLSEHESRNTLKFTANLAFHLYSRQPRTKPRALIRESPLLSLLLSPTRGESAIPIYSSSSPFLPHASFCFTLQAHPPSRPPRRPLIQRRVPSLRVPISSVCLSQAIDSHARAYSSLFLSLWNVARVFASRRDTPVFAETTRRGFNRSRTRQFVALTSSLSRLLVTRMIDLHVSSLFLLYLSCM